VSWLQVILESGRIARDWTPLPSVPGVAVRPLADEYAGLRIVGRSYGLRDERWRRESKFLTVRQGGEGLPELRMVVAAREDRVETLEQGGRVGFARLVRSAAVRRPQMPVVPPLLAAYMLLPLAQALERIHRSGYCYRAVGPDTVEAAEDGLRFVVTAPIGPAEDVGSAEAARDDVTRLQGTPSTAAVTPWSPPETLAEGRRTAAGDVWGLGAAALELMLGRAPWEVRGSVPLLRVDRVQEALRTLRTAVRGQPGEAFLGEVVARALEVDPAARPGAAEIANVIMEILMDEARSAGLDGWSLRLVLRSVLEEGLDEVWGARQAQAWQALGGATRPGATPAPAGPARAALRIREVEVRVDDPRERLRTAWDLIRTGRLILEVEV